MYASSSVFFLFFYHLIRASPMFSPILASPFRPFVLKTHFGVPASLFVSFSVLLFLLPFAMKFIRFQSGAETVVGYGAVILLL